MTWQARANRMALSVIRRVGNAVTIGATEGYGILQSPEEKLHDGMIFVTDYRLELPVLTWPYVAEGTFLTVDGVSYRSREESRPGKDGSSIFLPLEKRPPVSILLLWSGGQARRLSGNAMLVS
jgi:hypothetical protein